MQNNSNKRTAPVVAFLRKAPSPETLIDLDSDEERRVLISSHGVCHYSRERLERKAHFSNRSILKMPILSKSQKRKIDLNELD